MASKGGFWTTDWFFGLVFSIVFGLIAYGLYADSFARLETASYDVGMQMSGAAPSDRIAIIEIDDASIEAIGRWPWPRNLHAEMINRLSEGGAKVIGSTVLFSEAQEDPGLLYIEDLARQYDESILGVEAPLPPPEIPEAGDGEAAGTGPESSTDAAGEDNTGEVAETAADPAVENSDSDAAAESEPAEAVAGESAADADSDPIILSTGEPRYVTPPGVIAALKSLRQRMATAGEVLDTDRQLAESLAAAGNVVLPMTLTEPDPIGRPDTDLPPYLLENAVFNVSASDTNVPPLTYGAIQPPIPVLAENAAGLGHILIMPDVDGALRFEPLAVQYFDIVFPSFSLAVAAESLNLTPEDMEVILGRGVKLGNLDIQTTPRLLMYNYYYSAGDGEDAFEHYSFADVFQGIVPVERFRNKIVLIGATALGVGDSFPTPVSPNMAPVTTVAHTISAILQEDFITRPDWAHYAELGVLLLLALYLIVLLPRLRPGTAALTSLALLLGLLITEFSLLGSSALWLQLTVPAVFLVAGHLLITIKRFRVTDRIRLHSEAEGAESNKMLGLSFQQQGQLDMAFDKFRKCPIDDSVMDALYNLALDYERKRQFNKAGSVYSYMADHNPNYRDLKKRMKRSQAMEETVMLGGSGGHPGGTLMLDGDEVQKPMLGRYQVEKELGKGAMGVVYLGRDPKINRVVAIKTMALSQEFEADELDEVKERFFREAETAGRLNHPHIVTIYDAGEEHDLAYIAMEFLKGKDLVPQTKPDKLLPPKIVFDLIASAADALDYAHKNGVVHRDIKPANMMYDEEAQSLKLTDFGIARITDSSKTKTGMVLGTPSYMSPEQLAGTKVDGRSDLFSLGVTFYQMLVGQLPFRADSMATLMYKITNEEHAPATLVQPSLPECVDAIINKALEKDVEKRYQTGSELAADIRACAGQLAG